VIDPTVLQMVLTVLTGWLDGRERVAVVYLVEENGSFVDSSGTVACA
jgi:hypothetical protein